MVHLLNNCCYVYILQRMVNKFFICYLNSFCLPIIIGENIGNIEIIYDVSYLHSAPSKSSLRDNCKTLSNLIAGPFE